jgi:long-chain acyl-CoA synthetase
MDTFDNLVDMFDMSTARFADRPLFGVKRQGRYVWTTYREVAHEVDACRAGLAALGIGRGDRVAIISDNRPEWAIAAYATYGLGAQFVPMYEAQLAREWAYILRDSGAKLVFAANRAIASTCLGMLACESGLPALMHVVDLSDRTSLSAPSAPSAHSDSSDRASSEVGFGALLALGARQPIPSVKPAPDDICGFLYTSGTTGNPKGVLLTHRNITSNIHALHQLFPMGPDDVSLSFLPWAHCFGQTCELHCMLSYGAAMGLAESVSTLIDNLSEVRPTLLFAVPRVFNRIYDGVHKKMADASGLRPRLFARMLAVARDRKRLAASGRTSFALNLQFSLLDKLVADKIRARFGGRLKYAFSGGAALSREVGEFIDDLGLTVYEGYGLTETSPVTTANSPQGRKLGSIGRPLPGVRVTLAPAEHARDGEGELVIHGPNVMKGYHALPEETARAFTADGGFRTGDLGYIDADGFVYITGRIKEQYKLENGKYVVPGPLEEALGLSPHIANVMVDGTNRPYNVAVIVPDFESLEGWARKSGLAFNRREDLADKPETRRLIAAEIARLSSNFKAFERPEKFILVKEDFTTDNQMLTPSLKLKRRNVLARYGAELAKLYGR